MSLGCQVEWRCSFHEGYARCTDGKFKTWKESESLMIDGCVIIVRIQSSSGTDYASSGRRLQQGERIQCIGRSWAATRHQGILRVANDSTSVHQRWIHWWLWHSFEHASVWWIGGLVGQGRHYTRRSRGIQTMILTMSNLERCRYKVLYNNKFWKWRQKSIACFII